MTKLRLVALAALASTILLGVGIASGSASATTTPVPTFKAGPFPIGAAISKDGKDLWVSNDDTAGTTSSPASEITELNLKTKAIIRTFHSSTGPAEIAVSPNGKQLWVAEYGSGGVSVYSTSTGKLLHSITTGSPTYAVYFNPSHTEVWATTESAGVAVISTSTYRITHTIPLASSFGLTFTKSGSHAYIVEFNSAGLWEVDTKTYAVIGGPIADGTNPISVVLSKNGKQLFVVNEYSVNDGSSPGDVLVISVATSAVVATIPLADPGTEIGLLNSAGTRLYVTNIQDGTVTVVSTATDAVVSTISTGTNSGAYFPVFDKSGHFLYVTDFYEGKVSIIATADKATATVAFGGPNPVLNAGNRSILRKLAASIPYGAQHVKVHIVGYTNAISSASLDLERAGAAEAYLKSLGLSGSYSLASGGVRQREAVVTVRYGS